MVLKILFAGQQWKNRQREQTYGHGKRGRVGEMYGERNMETSVTICKTDSQWEFAVCLRELKHGFCINLEGWVAREMEGSFKRRHMYTYGRFILRFDRKQQNYVKQLSLN